MIGNALAYGRRHSLVPLIALAVSFVVAARTGFAQETRDCAASVLTLAEAAEMLRIDVAAMTELADQERVPGRRVEGAWRFGCQALLDWLAGAESVRSAGSSSRTGDGRSRLVAGELAEVTGAGSLQAQPSSGQEPATTNSDEEPDATIGEAPDERTAEDVFLRSQRVLLAPGQAVIDFGSFYTEFNGEPLATIADQNVLATLEQETFVGSIQARIGFRNETEVFVGTSYFIQDNEAFLGSQKIAASSDSDFGDLNFGVRRTLMREGVGRPNIIGSISTRIPTDDGAYALGAGAAFVKSFDPVVLFASIGYMHAFTDAETDLVRIEPSDRVDVAFGYALALNDRLALSMSVSGSFTASERREGLLLRQRDSYAVRFGLTSWLARGVYIEPSVSFNLGGPDDSFAFGLTVPYTLGRKR